LAYLSQIRCSKSPKNSPEISIVACSTYDGGSPCICAARSAPGADALARAEACDSTSYPGVFAAPSTTPATSREPERAGHDISASLGATGSSTVCAFLVACCFLGAVLETLAPSEAR